MGKQIFKNKNKKRHSFPGLRPLQKIINDQINKYFWQNFAISHYPEFYARCDVVTITHNTGYSTDISYITVRH